MTTTDIEMNSEERSPDDPFTRAVERLRTGLPALQEVDDLAAIQRGRDGVYDRYGRSFAPEQLPELSAEEYLSFLRFENNRHWTRITRTGTRTTADMGALRTGLAILLDEARPLAQRYDEAIGLMAGVGRAIATPILHVVYPDRYGVWNSKVEAGLTELELYPVRSRGMSDGEHYEAINDVLLRLAAALEINLWTLDNLWEWLARQRKLAAPFDKIFADRAQAEWVFGLFADAVERLDGGPDDRRFALTLSKAENRMRLNIGNSMVMDIADQGRKFHLTALKEPMEEAYSRQPWSGFSGESDKFAVYAIPLEDVQPLPEKLQAIYEQSMVEFGKIFREWKQSNLLPSHVPQLFEALFDEEKREDLLTNGLPTLPGEPRYWRITLPSDLRIDGSDGKGDYNFWADCLKHGIAAIGFDDQAGDPQITKFASIRPGDKVVAFLRNKTIGGVGVVTSSLDKMTEQDRPADRDFFHGLMWRRIGVDWTPVQISVDSLPPKVGNKFKQSTVMELSADEFAEVEKLINGSLPGPTVAREFKGFTIDAFDFLRELAANNNKAWLDANRDRWRERVMEPMRALFTDLGPHVKRLFDPYLLPDELEITPTTHKVLARINKNWSATPDSKYHEYYWGAFYRENYSRQTDAQLFVNIFPDHFRFGFYVGERANQPHNRLQTRILADPEGFYSLITDLDLVGNFDFIRNVPHGRQDMIPVRTADDIARWVEEGSFDALNRLTSQQAVDLGPTLADTILDTFRRVFPIYLWAVADDYQTLVERYLAAEFPIVDGEDDDEPLPYNLTDFIDHTHLTDERARELKAMLLDKRQVIFYGPPGTGKTYVARHLGQLLTGLAKPPSERLTVVQFHPAYGYEEFIEGIRPEGKEDESGHTVINYPVRPGAFVSFCREAGRFGDQPCVFIIDEINRGNIPRIFGELMYLLEYRGQSIPLPYSGKRFRIPENVYVIGTMNTADRSIALVDFALRRRFHFAHFTADPALFDRWLRAHPSSVPYLGRLYRELVAGGIDDPDYAIGPSVFMNEGMDVDNLRRVWEWSVLPYLREYHIGRPEAVRPWEWDSPEMRQLRGLPSTPPEPPDAAASEWMEGDVVGA